MVASACSRKPDAPVLACPMSAAKGATGGGPSAEVDTGASVRLLAEVRREIGAVKSSQYQHATEVDEESGRFDFDCSGFVAYALRIAAPTALSIVPTGPKGRPRATEFVHAFLDAPSHASSGWERVVRVQDVRAGDVIGWLRADDAEGDSTGHVMVALARPKCIESDAATSLEGGAQEWLVQVADSTKSGHADDSRAKETTGLGTGTIGLVVDRDGGLVGYRWKGGKSPKAHATTIAVGRLVGP